MALAYADRVKETSTTTGTGTYDLAGTATGFQTFVAGIGTGNTCYYTATDDTNWEVGLGTVTDATPDTLARTIILSSSNANAAVNWGAGTKTIFCTIPAKNAGTPTGAIIAFGAAAAPYGYLLCDGSAVSRTTYADLFAVISTGYGTGDGSTTFNVPDLRSRTPVGYGTGTVAETQAAANWNVSDIITVDSNTMAGKPKWLTGMPVVLTTTGSLPTGLSLATTYYVIRLSATTISLATSLVNAMAGTAIDITATGSGNHTLTCTLQARALADMFGTEINGDVPSHTHTYNNPNSTGTGSHLSSAASVNKDANSASTGATGSTEAITNMPPSTVVNFIIKT